MNQNPDIRRTPSGAIDLDFYREQARSLRAEWLRPPRLSFGRGVASLGIYAAIIAVVVTLGSATRVAPTGTDQAIAAGPNLQLN